MSYVVHKPERGHHCNVGWEDRPLADDHPLREVGITDYSSPTGDFDPPGTVRACETCGRTWVARRPYVNVFVNEWQPEGRIARWLRTRREARR